MRINDYLELVSEGGSRVYKCSRCGHVYGPASGNVKDFAKKKTFPITKAGPMLNPWVERDDFELREFYCPVCASMFSVELNKEGEPILWDISISE